MVSVLNYGGGRQTVAIACLIARGILPRPDRIVMADTGRERASTWAYLGAHVRPMLGEIGLRVEIAPRSLATVDLYGHNGDLLVPAYHPTGKLSAFCSGEWKRDVVHRYLRAEGIATAEQWIGFSLDERRRVARLAASDRDRRWTYRFPLVELMLTTASALAVIERHGKPRPPVSSCWMCPHQRNAEWRSLGPDEFASACGIDESAREEDIARGGPGVWLHHSLVPLREADLSDERDGDREVQCSLGMCYA